MNLKIQTNLSKLGLLSVMIFMICGPIKAPQSWADTTTDPGSMLDAPIPDSRKTQVLVLGTPHLSTIQDTFHVSMLDSLMAALERFGPDLIGIESLPPVVIDEMVADPDTYSDVLAQFVGKSVEFGKVMQESLQVSSLEARRMADSLMAVSLPGDPSERVTLRIERMQYLLASYDYDNALLQVSYFPSDDMERRHKIPDDIMKSLKTQLESQNEISSIALRLAKSRGLDRFYPIDDHKDKDVFMAIAPQLMTELRENDTYKTVLSHPLFAASDSLFKMALNDGNLLPYYRYLNALDYQADDVEVQWHLFFKTDLESGLDRSRAALWEVRNLNIASHIRRATTLHPGKRMLVIIGASHKSFLDSYLNQMMDIKVVQLSDF